MSSIGNKATRMFKSAVSNVESTRQAVVLQGARLVVSALSKVGTVNTDLLGLITACA